ncbi:MAG: STAS/SEC14 domain-containing protein [Burkholderiales bacterium]|nr:STAS/SEC14 domain-containing protein [Burkholderiales bacterium]
MPFITSITRYPEFVQLAVSGPAEMKNFVELVATIESETVYWSDRRVLADLRDVAGRLTAPEQVFLGELVAQNLPHLERLASLVPPDQITRNSENAAQEMGMQLRVFTSLDDAVAWLSPAAVRTPEALAQQQHTH